MNARMQLSEPATEVDTDLKRTAVLCEAAVHGLEVEGFILLIQCIVYPERYLTGSLVEVDAAVQRTV